MTAAPVPLTGPARRAGGASRSKDPAPFAPRRAARVGRRDVHGLRKAAVAARRTDSRSGGGSPGSLEVLRGVGSSRAREYLGALVAGLGRWEREPEIRAFASEATRLSRAPVSG